MNIDQDYVDMAHVADMCSFSKCDPKEAVKAQFSMWVYEKIAKLEERLAALENPAEAPEEEAAEQT